MGILKVAGRILLYGGISAMLVVPVAYRAGFKKGQINGPEMIAENQYKLLNPYDNKRYIADFNKMTLSNYIDTLPDERKKQLEDLFRE
jgi:hypothetical protein